MSGSWRSFGDEPLPAPLAAALSAFAEQGYHGTSIRRIAEKAHLSVPGLYHHYPSKQALLEGLVTTVMQELLDRSGQAVEEAGPSAQRRFDHVVECLLRFHMHRRRQAFIASTEIRSMKPEVRDSYIALRDEQQRMLDRIVEQGVAEGVFATAYPLDASRAVTTMCVAVATWFRPDGELGPDQVVERYLSLARATVRAGSA
ncbi:TetR/AcrR family transcriptional regulator [Nocardiopsis salina]|uniref:TetR/AcrR family transcriptional regulator n=1 Tax=Nocardiopsis salina TaxID=245836 RepID=UPI0003460F4C|nr:TetR/AcrR family transcriptional regulator [Nocardiopsis salina]